MIIKFCFWKKKQQNKNANHVRKLDRNHLTTIFLIIKFFFLYLFNRVNKKPSRSLKETKHRTRSLFARDGQKKELAGRGFSCCALKVYCAAFPPLQDPNSFGDDRWCRQRLRAAHFATNFTKFTKWAYWEKQIETVCVRWKKRDTYSWYKTS